MRTWPRRNFASGEAPASRPLRQQSSGAAIRGRGFALLYAVLVASLFLAIGATIASATLKNLLFSQSGRESQFAFYSADSGVECALYWDKIGGRFPTSTEQLADPTNGIKCNNEVLQVSFSNMTLTTATTDFDIGAHDGPPFIDGALCAHVKIDKYPDAITPGVVDTAITSSGYNTCDLANARRLQRGLFVTY